VDKTLAHLKETVKNSDRLMLQLYNEVFADLEDSGLNFIISSLSNIQHCLHSIRNKSINCSKTEFNNLTEVQSTAHQTIHFGL
jgi:hypothetical protein